MYKLYEKVPKTREYMYGSKLINNMENPFLEGPCLLCISGQYDNSLASKSNFGVTKEGMRMARLRVRGQKNAGFTLRDFPVKFLSIELDKKDEDKKMTSEERIEAFVNQYLLPLITKEGQKIDFNQAKKNIRNVSLVSKMQELGYTVEECRKIQSQMCVFSISTDRLTGTQKSTCISFKDINDIEVNDNVTQKEKQTVLESQIGESIFAYSDSEIAYLFSGDGAHSLKKYTRAGMAVPVCLSSAISKALENSILNHLSKDFLPITARTTYNWF